MNGTQRLIMGSRVFDLERRTLLMGILNVTPDSFYGKSRHSRPDEAADHALAMVDAGADIIDVGGESTRPGARPVHAEEEVSRVIPVIEAIRRHSDVSVTVDTFKADVARKGLDAGACGVNDISGMTFDSGMLPLVAARRCAVVISHIQGTPGNMQDHPSYEDVLHEIADFLEERARAARGAGVEADRIVIDPGIGFGKTLEHNLDLLANLNVLRRLGYPVLIGASRKSFIGKLTGLPPEERLEGSLAAASIGAWNGAAIVRVHDVRETGRALRIVDALKGHCRKKETF